MGDWHSLQYSYSYCMPVFNVRISSVKVQLMEVVYNAGRRIVCQRYTNRYIQE